MTTSIHDLSERLRESQEALRAAREFVVEIIEQPTAFDARKALAIIDAALAESGEPTCETCDGESINDPDDPMFCPCAGCAPERPTPKISMLDLAAVGEVVIVLNNGGRHAIALVRGHKVPTSVAVDYAHDGGSDGIRMATVKAGFRSADWKKVDEETRALLVNGDDRWRRLHGERWANNENIVTPPAPVPSTESQEG